MFGRKRVNVLISGAGPTGMMAALVLARNGIDTMIIDAAPRCGTRSNAMLIHPQTQKLFNRLGFAKRVMERAYRINRVEFYDDVQLRDTVFLSELPEAAPYALSLPQSELESILESELEKAGVTILWNHRLSSLKQESNSVTAEVDRYEERGIGYAVSRMERVITRTLHVHANLLVAADGYNSLTRAILKQKLEQLGKDQFYAFFDFETDEDFRHSIRVSLRKNLASAQIPMTQGLSRLAFQVTGLSIPSENRNKDREPFQEFFDDAEYLDDKHLKELIEKRIPWRSGYINRIVWRSLAPFKKRYLTHPRAGRVVFVGDSARTFSPLSMSGLNLGMQEAEQLATTIKLGFEDGRMPTLIDELGDRMVHNWRFIGDIENHCIPTEEADAWIAMNRARIMRALPAHGEVLEGLANQLFIKLAHAELMHTL